MPSRLQDLTNTNLSELGIANNKNVMRYNASTGRFDMVEIDTTLGITSSIPQEFIDVVEREIRVENLSLNNLDGGQF